MENPIPVTIQHAKRLHQETGNDIVLVVAITSPGKLSVASWGKNEKHCKVGSTICRLVYDTIGAFFARLATDHLIREQQKKGTLGHG